MKNDANVAIVVSVVVVVNIVVVVVVVVVNVAQEAAFLFRHQCTGKKTTGKNEMRFPGLVSRNAN